MVKKIVRKCLSIPLKIENRIYRQSVNTKFYEDIKDRMDSIPSSNGCRFYKKINRKIGIICDPFLYESYKNCCDLVYITPDNYLEVISDIDILLITSVWHGLNHEWDNIYHIGSKNHSCLKEIKKLVNKKGIPIAFYSKEDPPNFDIFKNLAEGVTVIFTSAVECIERYEEVFPCIPCYYLPFAINPFIHNPIGMFCEKYTNYAFFAGSWMNKYPIRTKEQTDIFDWFLKSNWKLAIADRNYSRENRNYYYPHKYRKYILPDFAYSDIAKLYKLFPMIINLNSVYNSRTMFAARVYDASASGSMIISNHSVGMEELFPDVNVIDSLEDLFKTLQYKQSDIDRIRLNAVRRAYSLPTVYDVISTIVSKTIADNEKKDKPSVLVIANKTNKTISDFEGQSFANKRIVFEDDVDVDVADYEMVAFWDDKYRYDTNYLEDMINAFKYTNSDYITKRLDGERHVYADNIIDKSLSVFWTASYSVSDIVSFPAKRIELKNGYVSD